MVAVKDLAASASKWAGRAAAAQNDYSTNAAAAGQRWATNAGAAQGTFQRAITAPGIANRYARGVQKAGSAKYTDRVTQVGATRYADGVAVAQGAWQSGFQPFAQALGSLSLSARGPRGDRGNLRRVEEVATRLNAVRIGQLGGGTA